MQSRTILEKLTSVKPFGYEGLVRAFLSEVRRLGGERNGMAFLRTLASGSLALLLVLTAAACSSNKKDDNPNTVHLGAIAKIKGLDPIYADDQYSGDEVGKLYEGLLQFSYLKRPYVLEPALAAAMPEASADGKVYTFKLKQGVLFQDDPCFKETQGKGRELTAEDFVFSFKRLADPKNSSPGWWVFENRIKGLDAWRDAASKAGAADYAAPVEGLKALDRYTLRLELNQAAHVFLYTLAMTFTKAVPKEAVEAYGKEFINHPVGTGPFRLESFNGSSRIVYVRNPTYRKEYYPSEGEAGDKEAGLLADAGKPLPLADKVIVEVHVESQPLWLQFMAGNIDRIVIPKDNYSQAVTAGKELNPELSAKGIRLQKTPLLDITHETFNMADPIFGKNKLLRQAISMAMDHGPFIELFYNGRALPAQGPIPPGLLGYDPNLKNPYRQFNLTKAKELLAKAGYPYGKGLPPIEYVTIADSTHRQMNEYFTKSLAALGVQLKINSYSWPEFQASVKNRRGQMWGYAWGADYPDAENFLQLFYSKNASPGPNDSNYSNPEFDAMYEKSLLTRNPKEREALYKKMVALVVEDAPWIWGVHRIAFNMLQPWFRNYKYNEMGHDSAKYYGIDVAAKKAAGR
jgi:oligopeptide transport system substrate-binding protein